MRPQILEQALRRAGATFLDENAPPVRQGRPITKADLMVLGLSGGMGAADRRQMLMEQLKLPKHLSPNAMLEVLNALFSYEELADAVQNLTPEKKDGGK